jgi:hypothetical protein
MGMTNVIPSALYFSDNLLNLRSEKASYSRKVLLLSLMVGMIIFVGVDR